MLDFYDTGTPVLMSWSLGSWDTETGCWKKTALSPTPRSPVPDLLLMSWSPTAAVSTGWGQGDCVDCYVHAQCMLTFLGAVLC